MPAHRPLVVAILHADEDDVDYQLYCQAYGLEMQIDNEWRAEVILLTPHDHLTSITKNTGVTGPDTAIVTAGITDVPVAAGGKIDVSAIRDSQNNWLLVGDPRRQDTEEQIREKLRVALDAGCRVIVCVSDVAPKSLDARLGGLRPIDGQRVVFAFTHQDAAEPTVATSAARAIRSYLAASGVTGVPRFIVAGEISSENAAILVNLDGIDGVMLMDDKYGGFETILEVLANVGS